MHREDGWSKYLVMGLFCDELTFNEEEKSNIFWFEN